MRRCDTTPMRSGGFCRELHKFGVASSDAILRNSYVVLEYPQLIGTPGKLSFEASLNPVGSDRYAECGAICGT